MKKEIIIKIVIEGDTYGSIIHRSGFPDNISASFETIGILTKLLQEEQAKLDKKLKTERNYTIKEPYNKDGI